MLKIQKNRSFKPLLQTNYLTDFNGQRKETIVANHQQPIKISERNNQNCDLYREKKVAQTYKQTNATD